MKSARVAGTCLGLFALTQAACGHGLFDERIATATEAINAEPGNVQPWLQRAGLHSLHGDWAAAEADLRQAEALNPDSPDLHLGWGRLLLAAGRYAEADGRLSQYLDKYPDHALTLQARAEARMKAGRAAEAAADYRRVIALAPHPGPEIYAQCARADAAAGDPEQALETLDAGIKRLGQLVTLTLAAVEIHLSQQDYAAALKRYDQLLAETPRHPTWLMAQGDILQQADRPGEARERYQAALKALQSKHERQRALTPNVELEQTLQQKLRDTRH